VISTAGYRCDHRDNHTGHSSTTPTTTKALSFSRRVPVTAPRRRNDATQRERGTRGAANPRSARSCSSQKSGWQGGSAGSSRAGELAATRKKRAAACCSSCCCSCYCCCCCCCCGKRRARAGTARFARDTRNYLCALTHTHYHAGRACTHPHTHIYIHVCTHDTTRRRDDAQRALGYARIGRHVGRSVAREIDREYRDEVGDAK